MKRKSSGTVSVLLLVVVVVCGGLAAGYYLTGTHNGQDGETPSPPATAPAVAVENPPKAAPVQPRHLNAAGQYIAPGAPQVMIAEVKTAPPVSTPPQTDSEESQTGVTPESAAPANSEQLTSPVTSPAQGDSSATASNDTESSQAAQTPQSTAPQPPTSSPSDATSSVQVPVGVPANPTPPASDEGASPTADTVDTGSLYKVEAGTFASEKNAKDLVVELKNIGFAAAVEPTDSTDTSFRVQVGAFRNRSAADDAVSSLQRQGYPAYITAK